MARDGVIIVGYTAGRVLGQALSVAGTAAGAAAHLAWYVAYLCDGSAARVDEAVTATHRARRGRAR